MTVHLVKNNADDEDDIESFSAIQQQIGSQEGQAPHTGTFKEEDTKNRQIRYLFSSYHKWVLNLLYFIY